MAFTDNILAYWKLDNSSWVDSTGNGYTLIDSGGVTNGTGIVGGDAVLNGSNNLTNNSFSLPNNSEFTISGWVNFTDYTNSDGRFIFSGSNRGDLFFGFHPYNNWLGIGRNQEAWDTTFSYEFNNDTWYHVAVTNDNVNVCLYLNGVLVSTQNTAASYSIAGGINIGSQGDRNYINGSIDEVGVWTRALTTNEVYNLYYNGSGNTYPFSNTTITPTLNDNILAYWKMDESIDNARSDSTGNGYDLQETNDYVDYEEGVINDAATFGGFYQGWLTYTDDGFGDQIPINKSNFSFACWFKPYDLSEDKTIAGQWDGGYEYSWLLRFDGDGHLQVIGNTSTGGFHFLSANINLNTDNWYHCAFTYDGNDLKLYVNSQLVGVTTIGGSLTNTIPQPLVIGSHEQDNLFNGSIDEVGIWNRALSQEDIFNLYYRRDGNSYPFDKPVITQNLNDDLLAYYPLDENTGTRYDHANGYDLTQQGIVGSEQGIIKNKIKNLFLDVTGNNNTLKIINGVILGSGKIGNGAYFNGVNSYLTLGSTDLNLTGDFSVSLWYKPTDMSNYQTLFTSTGNLSIHYNGNNGNNGIDVNNTYSGAISTSGNFVQNTWYYISVVCSSGVTSLYIDGVLQASTTQALTIKSGIYLGASVAYEQFYLNGTLDEVGIWDKALTTNEITTLYNSTSGLSYIDVSFPSGALAYWDFNSSVGYDLAASFVGIPNNVLYNNDIFTSISWSYSFWVNIRSDFSNTPISPIFISTGNINSGGYGFSQLTYFSPITGSNLIAIKHYDDYTFDLSNSYTTTYGTWNHVAVTNNLINGVSLYVNGNFVASTNDRGVNRSWTLFNLDGFNDGTYQFNGLLDDVKIWNRSITPNEIASIYKSGAATSKYNFQKVLGIPTYTFEKVTPQSIIDLPFYIKSGKGGTGKLTIPIYQDGLYGKRYDNYYPSNGGVDAFRTLSRTTSTNSIHGDEEATVDFYNFTSSDRQDYDFYSWQWTGYFKAPYTHDFVFRIANVDDSVDLWVGDNAILGFTSENRTVGGLYNADISSDPIHMIGGQYYPVRLQFGEDSGGDHFILEYSSSYETNVTNFQGRLFHLTHQDLPVSNPPVKNGSSPYNAGDSAYQIKTDFPSLTTATLYWIKNANINNGEPFQIYADMTTLGGGWTLLLNNHSYAGWTFANAISANVLNPPSDPTTVTDKYSIIAWADYIKKSPSNFDYMFDAESRGYNGAAYTALSAYSFTEQYAGQPKGDALQNTNGWRKNISEVVRFPMLYSETQFETLSGIWNYDANGIEFRMPYYANSEIGHTLITTNGGDGGWWGTLVSDQWNPIAPWIGNYSQSAYNIAANPTAIWYWVR